MTAAGVERVFHEKLSDTTTQQPVLTEVLASLRTNNTVTVARLNCLGHNSAHIMFGPGMSVYQIVVATGVSKSSIMRYRCPVD